MANKMRTGDGKFRPLAPPEASTSISIRTRRLCLDIRRAAPPVDEVDAAGNRLAIRDLHRLLLLRHRLHLQ